MMTVDPAVLGGAVAGLVTLQLTSLGILLAVLRFFYRRLDRRFAEVRTDMDRRFAEAGAALDPPFRGGQDRYGPPFRRGGRGPRPPFRGGQDRYGRAASRRPGTTAGGSWRSSTSTARRSPACKGSWSGRTNRSVSPWACRASLRRSGAREFRPGRGRRSTTHVAWAAGRHRARRGEADDPAETPGDATRRHRGR